MLAPPVDGEATCSQWGVNLRCQNVRNPLESMARNPQALEFKAFQASRAFPEFSPPQYSGTIEADKEIKAFCKTVCGDYPVFYSIWEDGFGKFFEVFFL